MIVDGRRRLIELVEVNRYSDSEGPADSDNELALVHKSRVKSVIWNYFGVKGDASGKPIKEALDKPVCKLCKKPVSAKRSNTTNLFHHLQEHHPGAYSEIVPAPSSSKVSKQKQPTLQQVINKGKRYDVKSKRAGELNKAVAYYLAKDMQPLYAVERPGFKKLVAKLDPKYALPSRNHFSEIEIPGLYNDLRDNVVRPQLKEAKYFSSTTDLWTSCANQPYLSLTVHFIDKEWVLQSYCLDTSPLFEDHTGQNISEAIKDIYQNWQLPVANLVATTTDNGSNFIAAYQQLNWVRLSCFGHNLDLAIRKSLNNPRIQQCIRKCHSLIELFHRSWKKN